MLELIEARLLRLAEARAARRRRELADRLRAEVPTGLSVAEEGQGIALSGRGLRRRFALDPAVRWLLGVLR